jgi:hypothetical protein
MTMLEDKLSVVIDREEEDDVWLGFELLILSELVCNVVHNVVVRNIDAVVLLTSLGNKSSVEVVLPVLVSVDDLFLHLVGEGFVL